MTMFRSDITHPQRMTLATVQNAAFFHMSDPGFVGETEVHFSVSSLLEVTVINQVK
jgi:hypothetical protein